MPAIPIATEVTRARDLKRWFMGGFLFLVGDMRGFSMFWDD